MSEPFPKPRPLPGDFDVRATRSGPGSSPDADPLAELARLVGREDPFRELFPRREDKRPSEVRAPVAQEARPARFPVPDDFQEYRGPGDRGVVSLGDSRAGAAVENEADDVRHSAYDVEPGDRFNSVFQPLTRRDTLRFPAMPQAQDSFSDPHSPALSAAAPEGEAPPLNADLWAQGMPEPVSTELVDFPPEPEEMPAGLDGAHKRTLMVLAAVLALTAGGLGATFLVRGGAHATGSSSAPPTIMADTGPTKVQPPDTSNASTGGEGTTALLEKSASDNVNNAKVVNTQERPVDLAQLPKATPAAQSDDGRVATASNAGSFPEPKKVKTILIRPDGSVVGESPAAAAPEAPLNPALVGVTMPALADVTRSVAPAQADAVAKPATPKSTARVATTPKSTPTPGDGAAPVKPKVIRTAAKPKPIETADAAPTPAETTASTSNGNFAVQLAAPSTEQDAKDIMARLQKKYADELGDHRPSIRKADKGDKSVYRVRVGNLSQDDAKSLCSKLQTGGGSCFVIRN